MQLSGRTIAILIAPEGTEDPEYAKPRDALKAAGATVVTIGLKPGKAKTVNNDLEPAESYAVDRTIDAATVAEFDGLVIPGGCVGADKLRASTDVVAFVRDMLASGKPVGAICHAPWTLVEADAVGDRTLTSYPTLKTDIENAGGSWVDREVCVDGNLITSRTPKDLPAFCKQLVAAFAEGHKAAA